MDKLPVPLKLVQRFKSQLDVIDRVSGSAFKHDIFRRDPLVPVSAGVVLKMHEEMPSFREAIGINSDLKKDKSLVIAATALASWRRTQFVYRFDDELFSALRNTDTNVELLSSVLLRLPAPCVWLDSMDDEETGVLVLLDSTTEEGNRIEYVLWFVSIVRASQIQAIVVPLDRKLDDAIQHAYAHLEDPNMIAPLAKLIAPFVAAAIYICSEEPDISGSVGRMNKQRIARREAPYGPTIHTVGARFGAAFRKARQERQEAVERGEGHGSPIPHMRRAHWHSYWLGPRDKPDQRRKVIKWLPPIAVNVGDDGAFKAVVRPVKP